MENALIALLHAVLHSLSPIHYFAFFIAFFAWVLVAMLTYLLRGNNIILGLMVLITFFLFFAAPVISYLLAERYVKHTELVDVQEKQLRYIDKVVFKGALKNRSARTLKECRLLTFGFPSDGSLVENIKAAKIKTRFNALALDAPLLSGQQTPLYISLGGIADKDAYAIYTFTFCK